MTEFAFAVAALALLPASIIRKPHDFSRTASRLFGWVVLLVGAGNLLVRKTNCHRWDWGLLMATVAVFGIGS